MLFSVEYFKSILIVLFSLLHLRTHTVWAISCAGCVDLDEINFDKSIVRFPYAIVKFDQAFPYGEKHEAFAQFSKAAHKATGDLLVATVGIKDYGEMENKQLGLRFNVHEKNFPGIFLFKGSVKDFIQFPGHLDVTLDNLKSFVTEHTSLYIGRDGCVKELNQLAHKFANQPDATQEERIAEAEKFIENLSQEPDVINAKTYVTFMRKINEKGYEFVEDEVKRLQRLKASKVNEAKKLELQNKLNILESFKVTKLTKIAGGEKTEF